MNGFVGSTFYDTINKFLIGLLLCLPVVLLYYPPDNLIDPLNIGMLCAVCWLTGLFAWGIIEFYFIPKLAKMNILVSITSRNNEDWINHEYHQLIKKYKIEDQNFEKKEFDHLDCITYTKYYLEVQKTGLLGNVPALESLSAFFRNFFFVLIEWSLFISPIVCFISNILPIENYVLIHHIKIIPFFGGFILIFPKLYYYLSVTDLFFIFLIYGLIHLSISLREKTEKKIYSLVLEAYLLGCTPAKEDTNLK